MKSALPPTLVLALTLVLGLLALPAHAEDDDAKTFDVTFRDTPIAEAIESIARTGGLNIIVGPEVEGTITITLRGVTGRQALDRIAKTLGLRVEHQPHGISVLTRHPLAKSARKPVADPEVREKLDRARERIAKLEQEIARARRAVEHDRHDDARKRDSAPKHETVRSVRMYDVRDLEKGMDDKAHAWLGALKKHGVVIKAREGTWIVLATPAEHEKVAEVLGYARRKQAEKAERRHEPEPDVAHLREQLELLRKRGAEMERARLPELRAQRERLAEAQRRLAEAQAHTRELRAESERLEQESERLRRHFEELRARDRERVHVDEPFRRGPDGPRPEKGGSDRRGPAHRGPEGRPDDGIADLRHEVRALRAEVRELSELIRQLLRR